MEELLKNIPKLSKEEKEKIEEKRKQNILNQFPNKDYFYCKLFWMEVEEIKEGEFKNKLGSNLYKFKKIDYDFIRNYFQTIPSKNQVEEFTNKYAIK